MVAEISKLCTKELLDYCQEDFALKVFSKIHKNNNIEENLVKEIMDKLAYVAEKSINENHIENGSMIETTIDFADLWDAELSAKAGNKAL